LESKEPLPEREEDKKAGSKKEVKSVREEKKPVKKGKKEEIKKEGEFGLLEEISQPVEQEEEIKPKGPAPEKPYQTTSKSKKKFFSRQTFGNAQKRFRRKSF